ncbi:caspase family protein, partial [Lentzea sp.]|uniref:caspase family protein n=1 Tax=Lentzea sp. TaxID=56099 RepID=UPI002ED41C9A
MTDQGLVYALLVGIDAYQSPWPALAGCGNDVTEAEAVLRTLVQDRLRLKVLRDGEATRKRVMAEFTTHLGQAGPDDVAFFWFSGHGSDEPVAAEHWHLEPTGRSQTLVCVDSRHQGVADLSDKTLSAMIDLVAESGAHVAV